ncbi:MAG: hypothetical protein KY395_06480 [Actinobacteria bacterium]|nr:hypothetical protein [Actinomycetota bacterium]
MHDPRLEDHALGIELQLAELVDQADRARVQGLDDEAKAIQAEIDRLQQELAETAEKVAEATPPVEVDAGTACI